MASLRPPPGLPQMHSVPQAQPSAPGQLSPEVLAQKSNKWRSLQNRRYGEKRKAGFIDTGKQDLPPEHVRKILKARKPTTRLLALTNTRVLYRITET